MKAANFTEFRTKLKQFLDDVEKNNETLIIKRGPGNGAVLISLDEYNSILETMHLLSSKANADKLYESISQMKTGNSVEKELIEE
jgi:antitoxin YefM